MNNLIQLMIEREKEKIKEISINEKKYLEHEINKYNNISIDEIMGKKKPPDDEAIIVIQDGGIGDTICSTVMIDSLRKINPNKKIILSCFYPEIYLNNPNIDCIYSSRNFTDLYEKWIKKIKYNSSILKKDIYSSGMHRLFPGKLSEAFCHFYGVPFHTDNPKVYLSKDEDYEAKKILSTFPREVILIHPYASRLNSDPKVKLTINKDWLNEYWKELVSMITDDFDVVQIGGCNEEEIEGITTYLSGSLNIRQTMALVKNSLSFISVDSFIGHVGPAVSKSGVVLFGRSNPYVFGHDSNINIWVDNSCKFGNMFCGRPESNLGDFEMYRGKLRSWECPHRSCMAAIEPEMVYKKLFEAIEINTRN